MLSCANTGRISGGPKDVTPPKPIVSLSTPDKQVNFNPKELTFFFDEFVEVKDPLKQVIVSPPLTYIPSIKSRGKKIIFTFDDKEILRENATYTINFGEAIVDFHEGNKLNNYTFVFSTGPDLDSLSISGKIIHAKTGEPEQEMIVVLYDILEDSIVRKEKPFYFTRPDRNGNFVFRNIRSGNFKVFALKDENLNYKYDLETERIAFLNEPVQLEEKSVEGILLYASLPVPPLSLKTKEIKNYGKATLHYNSNVPANMQVMVDPEDVKHFVEVKADSVSIYYDTLLDSFKIYVGVDTVKVFPKGRNVWIEKVRLISSLPFNKKRIHPADSVVISFSYPLENIDFQQINISDTTGVLEDVSYRLDIIRNKLIINYPWELGENYKIAIDSNAITDIYGHVNDKINYDFSVLSLGTAGTLIIDVEDLDSTKNYVVHILIDKTPIYGYTFNQVSSANIELTLLEPMKYNIEIFEDGNGNGQWDPGDYFGHRQPELSYTYKGDLLKVNRENKVQISWTKSLKSLLNDKDSDASKFNNPFENRK